MDFPTNQHVFIKLKNGESYDGLVASCNANFRRLSLKNVTKYPGKIQVSGVRHFDLNQAAEVKEFPSDGKLRNLKVTTAIGLAANIHFV